MGTKKLLNASSSPPIAYKRHSNNCEDETPLRQQTRTNPQHIENINTTCLLQKQNTNKMFTKIRNYLTQLRTASTAALAATQKHCSQQQRKRHHHQHYRHQKLTECNSIPIVQSTNNMLSVISIVVTLVFLASINGVAANPVFVDNPSLAQFQSGRNIRHLPCIVRKSGRSGVCMFAIDCIKQNGTHLGTCIDRFYFGSCCDIKEKELTEIADNSIDQNTISHHFTSDSSTLPTSALFKLTTLSPLQQHENITTSPNMNSNTNSIASSSSSSSSMAAQQDVTQILNSVTQSLVAINSINGTQRPLGPSTTKPFINSTSTAKPSQQTTHKHSHFVIRTTTKPTKYTTGAKPSHNTTIKRKTTPSTTTKKTTTTSTTTTPTTKQPILTTTDTVQQKENLPGETTTQPEKLFTYQIVETTAYTPTEEATNIFDFVTTDRSTADTTKMPQASTTTLPPKATTTKQKETTIGYTEALTTQKVTTIKTKPQTTRKPTTTKKPTSFKRTTINPTRRPITTTTTTNPTDFKVSSDYTTEIQNFSTSTAGPTSTTSTKLASNKTTLAPRPRPRPTASIVKVPKPTTATTTRTPTTTTIEAEKIGTTTISYTTTTKKPTTSTTQSTPTTTTVTTMTTPKATSSTTPRTTATTTHKTTHKPIIISSTTHKPGLVTWTNIDGKPIDASQPLVSDWVPVTSQAPMNIHNKIEELPSGNVSIEEMDVSVSSSVSAIMNNTTVIISAPQKPMHVATTTAPATIITTPDSSLPTFRPNTSSTASSEQQTTSSTADPSPSQFTTEGISASTTTSPSGAFSTEETATENLNLNSTTTSPFAGLEGVDYRQVCGRRMFPEPRIVGGSNAAFGRWPWQISLRQWRTSTYLHKCGAALLNENWAITAAHCVDNVPPSDLLLRLGEYDLAEEEEPYGYQERRVQIVASHPQFDPRTFEYDLALLRFYEPVVFQPNIIPVCVPESDEDFIGQTAFVTGWGRLYEDGPLPSVLQEVAVPVINNTICESMYRAAGYIEHIPHIFICAGWKKGGYDSCEGDSGGPMVLQRESDKRFQLGGVISWGIGCAEANQPGVYTRISEFRDWINQILQF